MVMKKYVTMQSKTQYNEKGQRHGKWTKYYLDGRFNYIESYINDDVFGYSLCYYYHFKKIIDIEKKYYAK
jgi:hypothetical protein